MISGVVRCAGFGEALFLEVEDFSNSESAEEQP